VKPSPFLSHDEGPSVLLFLHRLSLGVLPLLTEEGRLESKRVHDIQFLEDDDSPRRFLAFLNIETAVFETEQTVSLAT